MTRLHRLTKISAVLLGLVLASSNAAADYPAGASVEARLKNSQMTVIDLTPRDGKAPGYSFPAFSQSSTVSANLDMAGTMFDLHRDLSNGKGSNIYTGFYHEGATANANTGEWGQASARMYVSGQGLGQANVDASARQLIGVSVGAHSRLVYSGLAEIMISEWSQTATNRTFNSGSVSVSLNGEFKKIDFRSEDFSGGYAVRQEEFTLFYDNTSDAAKTIWMSVSTATAMNYTTTAPIPEPETYAMLGVGALVVGAAARRRRRRSTSSSSASAA